MNIAPTIRAVYPFIACGVPVTDESETKCCSVRARQMDDICKFIVFNPGVIILIQTSLKFVPKG